MHFKVLPNSPSSFVLGQVHLRAYQNKAEYYCTTCRYSVCITCTFISTRSSGTPLKHLHTKLPCLTAVLLGDNINGWALWEKSTAWKAQGLKSLKTLKVLIVTVAIVFVHKLWRYSDFSYKSIPLFQEGNIFSIHFSVQTSFKCMWNTNIPILNLL